METRNTKPVAASSLCTDGLNAAANIMLSGASLKIATDYTVIEDEPDRCVLRSKVTPLDTDEYVTFRCKDIKEVNTRISSQYPAPINNPEQYSVTVESTLRSTDSDGAIVCDEPVVCQVIFRHNKTAGVTGDIMAKLLARAVSSLCQFTGATPVTAGSTKYYDFGSIDTLQSLMRGGKHPTLD